MTGRSRERIRKKRWLPAPRKKGAYSLYFDCLFAAAAPSGQAEDKETYLASPRKGGAIREPYVIRFPYVIGETEAYKLDVPKARGVGERYVKLNIDQGLGKPPKLVYVKLWFSGVAHQFSSISDTPYAGVAESDYIKADTAGHTSVRRKPNMNFGGKPVPR